MIIDMRTHMDMDYEVIEQDYVVSSKDSYSGFFDIITRINSKTLGI